MQVVPQVYRRRRGARARSRPTKTMTTTAFSYIKGSINHSLTLQFEKQRIKINFF
jgi:hypothetical protein